jgi:hypothetical protein
MRNLRQDLESLDRSGNAVIGSPMAKEWLERAIIAEEALQDTAIQIRDIADEVRAIRDAKRTVNTTSTIDLVKELRNRGYDV